MRVVVCGFGRFGRLYAERASEHAGMDVAGVVELGAMMDEVRAAGYRAFDSLGEAISTAHPQLVIVATPPEHHALLGIYALQRYCNVMMAKPGALSLDEAERVATTAWHRRRALIVDWTPLHSQQWRHVKSLVGSPPLTMRMVRRGRHYPQPCGALWDLAPHDIAMALDIDPADAVRSVWACGWWLPQSDEPRGAWLLLKHRSGRTTRIEVDWISPITERRVEILDYETSIVWNQLNDTIGQHVVSQTAHWYSALADPEMYYMPSTTDNISSSLDRAQRIITTHEADDSERYLNVVRILDQAERSMYDNDEEGYTNHAR